MSVAGKATKHYIAEVTKITGSDKRDPTLNRRGTDGNM